MRAPCFRVIMISYLVFFSRILLVSDHMIFLAQFGINVHLYIFFLRPQIALALWDRTILSLKKFTPAYLFQISPEIM